MLLLHLFFCCLHSFAGVCAEGRFSGQNHMFVLHFSLASVTESQSWSFSLGLKDFFPPAPVRCPNCPWPLKLMTSQLQRGCCYGWLCFCNLVVTWCLTKFPQLYTEFKCLIQMSLSKSGENITVNLQPLSKERSGPAFKLCKETGTISTHEISSIHNLPSSTNWRRPPC